jgi:hypothetical protein
MTARSLEIGFTSRTYSAVGGCSGALEQHEQFVAGLERVNLRSELAVRHQFEEELDFVFVWRRRDRIRTLRTLLLALDSQGRVLPRGELEFSSRIDADHPELGGQIDALGDARSVMLIADGGHG